jgi:hypothetical protein
LEKIHCWIFFLFISSKSANVISQENRGRGVPRILPGGMHIQVNVKVLMPFLCHTESDNQLHGGDLDVEDGGALFVEKFTRTECVFMPNIAVSLQPQSSSTFNRIKGLLTDPGLATRPAACAKHKSLFDFPGGDSDPHVFVPPGSGSGSTSQEVLIRIRILH